VEEEVQQDPALLNQFSVDGFQGLGFAAYFGQVEVVEYLIKSSAKVNDPSINPMHVLPLHSAVAGRHMQISEILLETGANVNAVQQGGFTPLHVAAANGQIEMVQLLECFHCDRSIRLEDGRTALDLARKKGFAEVAALMQ
jgi:uncharacterized protein